MLVDHPAPAAGTACTGGTRRRGRLARSGSTRRFSATASALDTSVGKKSRSCERRERTGRCKKRLVRDTLAPSQWSVAWYSYEKSTRNIRSRSTDFRARMSKLDSDSPSLDQYDRPLFKSGIQRLLPDLPEVAGRKVPRCWRITASCGEISLYRGTVRRRSEQRDDDHPQR